MSKSLRRSQSAPTNSTDNDFLPPKLRDLFFRRGPKGKPVYKPSRYKIAYGGRGSGKSWGFAGMGIALGYESKHRILCVREYQSSTRDSIHQLMSDRVDGLALGSHYDVQGNGIYGTNGTEVLFAGIKTDPGKIKSFEGPTICIVEEAERISKPSWDMLIPTIRGKGDSETEIWICFNPRDAVDETYKKFVIDIPNNALRVKVNWYDNPWFPADLNLERLSLLRKINETKDDDERVQLQQDYDHIWEGECQMRSDASVFRRRVVIESFEEPPDGTTLRYGADWGFANDPTALVRMWTTTNEDKSEDLWISHEAFGYRVENDELPQLFDTVPGSRKWPIKADSARPETISHMAKKFGFRITAADKWPGSLEDGLAHVKSYNRIHIHSRCKHLQEESRMYTYKIDKNSGEVLPIVVDKWNHGWDAVRYGLDALIKRKRSYFG